MENERPRSSRSRERRRDRHFNRSKFSPEHVIDGSSPSFASRIWTNHSQNSQKRNDVIVITDIETPVARCRQAKFLRRDGMGQRNTAGVKVPRSEGGGILRVYRSRRLNTRVRQMWALLSQKVGHQKPILAIPAAQRIFMDQCLSTQRMSSAELVSR